MISFTETICIKSASKVVLQVFIWLN